MIIKNDRSCEFETPITMFIKGAIWQAENMPIHVLDVENIYVHIKDGVIIVEKNKLPRNTNEGN